MAYNDPDGAGVGGWLAFLVISLAVLAPIANLIFTATALYGDPVIAAAYGEDWMALQLFEWTLVAFSIALGWYLAWRLTRVQVWRTVPIVIAGLWALALGMQLIEAVGVSLFTGIAVATLIGTVDAMAIRPLIVAALWTAYLLRSRRVANTYPRHLDADDAAEVFG